MCCSHSQSTANKVSFRPMDKNVHASIKRYALYFLAWTVIGLFFLSEDLTRRFASHDPTPWWHYLITWMAGVWLLAALTPVVFFLSRRYPIERQYWLRRVALHIGFSIAFAVFDLVTNALVLPRLGVFPAVMKTAFGTLLFLIVVAASFHGN